MAQDIEEIKEEIGKLETEMMQGNFWEDKVKAQAIIKRIGELKDELQGANKYDKGSAILSILSGAGGDDAEDFSAMLLRMYSKYIERKGWQMTLLHENKNDVGGYRNISLEVSGPASAKATAGKEGVYGTLKNESGVHRLVRISPFNAKSLRHTSFSLIEVVPKLEKNDKAIEIPPEDLRIEFSKAGGPGGQNVNKRETAVRLIHIPTNISVHVTTERSQEQNRERAMEIIKGKLYKKREEDKLKEKAGLSPTKTTEIEWGSQIRSYVLHPYKMVKDHRTGVESSNIDAVLESGMIDEFIEAEAFL
ncbi:MAG: PCRF domain-containing protein [Candidatus Paceibacterota bacterium]|jgi:peptide chain release factor 2